MAIEDHPLFSKWKDRLERLIEVKDAYRNKSASQADVDKAQVEYNKIADEI